MSRFEPALRSPLDGRMSRPGGGARLVAAAVLLGCACSSAAREAPGGSEAALVPESLRVLALPGGNGVLEVTALTLRKGELMAALKNTGKVPACHAAFAVELFDGADRSLTAGITGLLTQQFYRRTDGTAAIAACVAPGERTMAVITDLPGELAIDDVAAIVYRCPYFALDVEPIAGLNVERVKLVARDVGVAYAGTLANTLEVSVERPSVTVFPVNSVGRPLGVAMSTGDVQVPPSSEWQFETGTVDAAGATAWAAFPAGALSER